MKISVLIASYNYAQYIEEAINSVINQSYQDWELIIADDGSSDNSVEIIKQYCQKDSRIKLFQHENRQNKGLKETLLLGITHATGDWIAFLESDDAFMPENLQKKVEIIEKYPDIKLIFNKVNFLSTEKTKKQIIFEKTQEKLSKMIFPRNMFQKFFINNMILTFSCVMVEAKTLKNTDFNSPVDALLDWWLWINISHKNAFYYINEELTLWRIHPKSYVKTSKIPKIQLVPIKAYWAIYQQNKSLKLLIFIIYSFVAFFLTRFLKKFINL